MSSNHGGDNNRRVADSSRFRLAGIGTLLILLTFFVNSMPKAFGSSEGAMLLGRKNSSAERWDLLRVNLTKLLGMTDREVERLFGSTCRPDKDTDNPSESSMVYILENRKWPSEEAILLQLIFRNKKVVSIEIVSSIPFH